MKQLHPNGLVIPAPHVSQKEKLLNTGKVERDFLPAQRQGSVNKSVLGQEPCQSSTTGNVMLPMRDEGVLGTLVKVTWCNLSKGTLVSYLWPPQLLLLCFAWVACPNCGRSWVGTEYTQTWPVASSFLLYVSSLLHILSAFLVDKCWGGSSKDFGYSGHVDIATRVNSVPGTKQGCLVMKYRDP